MNLITNLSSSSGSNGGNSSLAESGQAYDYETGKPNASSGKIYLADKRIDSHLTFTDDAMLEAGTISNGKVTLALPSNVPSRFLEKIDSVPAGVNIEPLGVEAKFRMG